MNDTNTQQNITLHDIWELFLQRVVIIVLVTAITVGVFFIYTQTTYVPLYQSTATLYISGDDSFEGNSSADAYNIYTLAMKVVSDCDYLLSSRSVVDQLIQGMKLKTNFAVLQSRISTKNPTNTRILEVTVEAESPDLAKVIVDRLCEIGEEKINEVMGANYVQLYEYGTLNAIPCNQTPKSSYILVGSGAAIITFGLCLLLFLLDDRIRSTEQIEHLLGLSVLGDIPDSNALNQRGRYGYYRSRGYGKYAGVYGPYGSRMYGSYGAYGANSHQKSKKKGGA